jgi:hypothetical protein
MKTMKKAQTGGKLIDKPMRGPGSIPKEKPIPTPPSNPFKPTKSRKTKAKNGTSLGMKSVKAGFDKNPGVTRADIITAATKKAKSGSKIKKAQDGDYLDSTEIIAKAGPMRKTKIKERSTDGNYVTKTVTRTRPAGTTTSSKTRRTLQGYLTGAPRANEIKKKNGGKAKSGTSMKKCKGGC